MNARKSSFPLEVEKAELVIAEPLVVLSLETLASMVTLVTATVWPVKLTPVRFALLIVAFCEAGVNANPLLPGVTV